MRTLSAPLLAAVDAVVTAPGHLVQWNFAPVPALWSDVGQVVVGGVTWAAVDMRFQGMGFSGDAKPSGFSLTIDNLDSAIGALLLANDIAGIPLKVFAFDRAVTGGADSNVLIGDFSATQVRIGIDKAVIACVPIFYTVPFRRIDPPNGFNHAIAEGTKITWGRELTIFEQSRYWELN